MNEEELVISIGGSILLPEGEDVSNLKKLSDLIQEHSRERNLYIVVGGGKTARDYINWGRKLSADETTLDELGIKSSRLNAKLLIAALGKDVYPVPAQDFKEAESAGNHYSIVTMGGTHPGHTTDAVSAILAEKLGTERLIKATSVDGVYTKDPNKHEDAEKLEKLTHKKLIDIVSKDKYSAGSNVVFDQLAAKIIKRANIKTHVLDGRDLKSLENTIKGKEFNGTTIESKYK